MVTLVGWNDGGGYDCDERRRRRSSVARVREPEKREEGIGESESGPGVRGILRATGKHAERQEVAGNARARAPRFPSAYWQEEEDGSALGGLGRYSARTGRPAQVTLSLSVF